MFCTEKNSLRTGKPVKMRRFLWKVAVFLSLIFEEKSFSSEDFFHLYRNRSYKYRGSSQNKAQNFFDHQFNVARCRTNRKVHTILTYLGATPKGAGNILALQFSAARCRNNREVHPTQTHLSTAPNKVGNLLGLEFGIARCRTFREVHYSLPIRSLPQSCAGPNLPSILFAIMVSDLSLRYTLTLRSLFQLCAGPDLHNALSQSQYCQNHRRRSCVSLALPLCALNPYILRPKSA